MRQPHCLHGALAEGQLQHGDEGGAKGEAEVAAHVQEAGEESAALVRGVLAHEGGGAGVLAAGGEALDKFEQDQQGRSPDADLRVAGQQADGEGAGGHEHQGRGEDLLAADLVAEPAEDDSAEGAGDEGGGEGSQQEQGLDGLVRLRQEHRSHGGDQVAEHADVVPLHGVTHDGAAECFLEHRLVDDVDVGLFESTATSQLRFLRTLGCALVGSAGVRSTPAEESVVLRSVGIWAAPREVICLRLVAAPLWAGFQFYANSMVFPSLVPYDRPFRVRIGGNSLISFARFHRADTGNRPSPRRRAQNFPRQPSIAGVSDGIRAAGKSDGGRYRHLPGAVLRLMDTSFHSG